MALTNTIKKIGTNSEQIEEKIREHLKKIDANSEQTCKVREHLKKIDANSEQT